MSRNLRSRFITAAAVIVAVVTLAGITACSPEQQALYAYAMKEATPEEAVAIDNHVREWFRYDRWFKAIAVNEAAARAARPSMHPFLVCVRRHESDRSGSPYADRGYTIVNQQGSSASGAYQFLDSTWRKASANAGYPGYSRAMYAPVAVQDAVALHLYAGGKGASHWAGTGCY